MQHPRIQVEPGGGRQVGRGHKEAAGRSSSLSKPPARRQPAVAIHVVGAAVAARLPLAGSAARDATSAQSSPGQRCHPEKWGPDLRGSMPAGALRCFRKFRSTYTMLTRICRGVVRGRTW